MRALTPLTGWRGYWLRFPERPTDQVRSRRITSSVIDEIERIREELFVVQKALEKLEVATSIPTNGGNTRKVGAKTT